MSLRGSELFDLQDLQGPAAQRGYAQPWQVRLQVCRVHFPSAAAVNCLLTNKRCARLRRRSACWCLCCSAS